MLNTLNDVRQYLKIARADDCAEELDKVAEYLININLQPTEEEVLKKFEELGYEILISPTNKKHIQIAYEENDSIIEVYYNEQNKTYWYECRCFGVNRPQVILPNEHQLLTKLFKAWGLFNE